MICLCWKSKTGLCLLILFASFLINYHGVNAKPVSSVSFDIKDPKELENKQGAIDQVKKNIEDKSVIPTTLDAAVQNKKTLSTIPKNIYKITRFLRSLYRLSKPDYMTACHFKICNMG